MEGSGRDVKGVGREGVGWEGKGGGGRGDGTEGLRRAPLGGGGTQALCAVHMPCHFKINSGRERERGRTREAERARGLTLHMIIVDYPAWCDLV